MNARQARNVERWAAEDAAAKVGHTCLLCGGRAVANVDAAGDLIVWDLCGRCNDVFRHTAELVAACMPLVVDGPAAAVLEHVAGQLELDGDR